VVNFAIHLSAIAVVKRKLLVVGGANSKNAVTGMVATWNSTWHASDPAAIGYSNYLIVVGGIQSVDDVIYDDQWIRAASLPYSVTSMLRNVLHLAGGLGSNPTKCINISP